MIGKDICKEIYGLILIMQYNPLFLRSLIGLLTAMPNLRYFLQIRNTIILMLVALMGGSFSYAFDPSFYASNSILSQGNWAKIEVTESGMQFISDAALKNLGFADPEKVNIYGYGGVVIPENLDSPDDLPMVASLRVNGGLLFFGKNSIGWERKDEYGRLYNHLSHPYSDNSYYFISDVASERKAPLTGEEINAADAYPISIFTERLVHEQDLSMPMTTGRLMLGEDFKVNTAQNFRFLLTGNTGDAVVTTSFGCKTSSGTSSLSFTANGRQLEASTSDRMTYSASKLIVKTTTVKNVAEPGNTLDLSIKFNGSGSVSVAALDFIEVEYPRSIDVGAGDIYFYINPSSATEVKVAGASSSTVVWDVTNPDSPVLMKNSLSGSTLSFVSKPGYHEYVAFDPSKVSRAVKAAGKVSNQDIHSMEAPDMLVICPPEFQYAAQRLKTLHDETDRLKVAILAPEVIYNEFSCGKPDVSAFRKLLKMWYDRAYGEEGNYPAYCLIMSRPTYDNKLVTAVVRNSGYPRVPIWQSESGDTETTSYSTDDYIGMLRDVSGNFNIGTAEIQVAVGRMPFKSLSEANTVIDKLVEYVQNPDLGAWRNNVMVIADDQDSGVHLQQAEEVVNAMRSATKGNDFLIEKLYLDAFELVYSGKGPTYPQAHERMMNKWNEGTAFINYIGHANPKSWGHEYLLTWTDINSMTNKRLPYIYAATCEFLRWDADDISGAEALWLLPGSGVIGMISPSREVLITANGVLNKATSKYVFREDKEGNPFAVGDVMRLGKNDSNTGTNKLRYGLIGDPSMKLPWPVMNVQVDSINGIHLDSADEYPMLKARSSVSLSGSVTDREGNTLDDFNGIIEISLYDAEKVITTNGNGADGVVSMYNDRKTRLFVGRTKVVGGKWSTLFTMPSEIENNYSPALLSLYAYADDSREANGACEKLYAYGYDEEAPDDFEGPKIIEFYIDNPNFKSGNQVSPNPVVTAKFYDESGISVSEAGIGHSITLDLDGKTYYDDVAQYFIPDEENPGAGSITYALGEVVQGEHTLSFTVWDNANNSTSVSLDFNVSALWKPAIEVLTTDVNPATSNVNFIIATDGATSSMECIIEVYDIWGKKVWREVAPSLSGASTRTTLGWDLCDFGGAKVQSGVYLYRATVKTESGATVNKTKKLLVR